MPVSVTVSGILSFFARISSIDANSSVSFPVVAVSSGASAWAWSSSSSFLSGYVDVASNGGKSISRYMRTTVAEVCNWLVTSSFEALVFFPRG